MVTDTPEQVVQRQVETYNAHDIDGFMATYSRSVKMYNFPSGEVIPGDWDAVRVDFAKIFETKPHIEIPKRMVKGSMVVDYELGHDEKGNKWELIAMYQVIDGLIENVWFIDG